MQKLPFMEPGSGVVDKEPNATLKLTRIGLRTRPTSICRDNSRRTASDLAAACCPRQPISVVIPTRAYRETPQQRTTIQTNINTATRSRCGVCEQPGADLIRRWHVKSHETLEGGALRLIDKIGTNSRIPISRVRAVFALLRGKVAPD